jgi:hypothetical protein
MIYAMTDWSNWISHHFVWNSYGRCPIPFFMTIEDGAKAFAKVGWPHIEIGCDEYPATKMHLYFHPEWKYAVIKNVYDCAEARTKLAGTRCFVTEKQCRAMKAEIISKMRKLFPSSDISDDPIVICEMSQKIQNSVK